MIYNQLCQQLCNQFGATIDMLANCIKAVPDDYFSHHRRTYYITYHTIVFLDYYSSFSPSDFSPILSFSEVPEELRPSESIGDMVPDAIYTKTELLHYSDFLRTKCREFIFSLNEENLQNRFKEGSEEGDMDYPLLEIVLYNMRHTAHHVGQIQLLIRQELNQHMEWSFRSEV